MIKVTLYNRHRPFSFGLHSPEFLTGSRRACACVCARLTELSRRGRRALLPVLRHPAARHRLRSRGAALCRRCGRRARRTTEKTGENKKPGRHHPRSRTPGRREAGALLPAAAPRPFPAPRPLPVLPRGRRLRSGAGREPYLGPPSPPPRSAPLRPPNAQLGWRRCAHTRVLAPAGARLSGSEAARPRSGNSWQPQPLATAGGSGTVGGGDGRPRSRSAPSPRPRKAAARLYSRRRCGERLRAPAPAARCCASGSLLPLPRADGAPAPLPPPAPVAMRRQRAL